MQRISKIKPFTSKYSGKRINCLPLKYDWKTFKNNLTVAVNVFYAEILQKRRKNISCLHFKIKLKLWKKKKNYPFDDFKQKDGIMLKLKKII